MKAEKLLAQTKELANELRRKFDSSGTTDFKMALTKRECDKVVAEEPKTKKTKLSKDAYSGSSPAVKVYHYQILFIVCAILI